MEKKEVTWKDFFKEVETKDYYLEINNFLIKELEKNTLIIPEVKNILLIFKLLKLKDVKKVIIGQDPYTQVYKEKEIEIPYATGIAFGVPKNIPKTPSLKILEQAFLINNQKETFDKTLLTYVNKGYFFINKTWTGVGKKQPMLHDYTSGIKWYLFTIDLLKFLSLHRPDVIIYFLGNDSFIDNKLYKNKYYSLYHPSYIARIKNKDIQFEHIKKLSRIFNDY